MNPSRLRAIYRKDMREALRDSRVLTAILMPLLVGLLYSFMFPDDTAQKITIGIVASGGTALTRTIADQAPKSVRLQFVTIDDEAALRAKVRAEDVDVGLILSPGFDDAARAGRSPRLVVVLPTQPSYGGDYIAAAVDRATQILAARRPPADIVRETTPPDPDDQSAALASLGPRTVFILISIIMLLTMVAVYAVPAVLVEETEKRTLDALTLIASTGDVIVAKALFGITLSVVSVPLLLVVTRASPYDYGTLLSATLLSAVVLVGIGLLFAGLVRTQQQVNTWSGALLLLLFAPAFTIGLSLPDKVNTALAFLPTVYTFRLAANAFAGHELYPDAWSSYVVLTAWAVGVYGLLRWRLARQEA